MNCLGPGGRNLARRPFGPVNKNSGQEMLKVEYLKLRCDFYRARTRSREEFRGFRCNICGEFPVAPVSRIFDREEPSCYHCGSSLRFRSIIAALSLELFGEVLPLPEMPADRGIRGIGISDSRVYANPLKKRFSYRNTFHHKRPRLDIMNPGKEWAGAADFVITSDVLEHVRPPVAEAFRNLHALLRPGGACILTVPYLNEGVTREHFPDLHDYRLIRRGGRRILVNRTREGEAQEFTDLQFHGGTGATLEMRLFARDSLLEHLRDAGFERITIHRESIPEFGICLDRIVSSYAISARRRPGIRGV